MSARQDYYIVPPEDHSQDARIARLEKQVDALAYALDHMSHALQSPMGWTCFVDVQQTIKAVRGG